MKDKVFLGRVKVINTRYGEMVKVSFGPKDLEMLKQTPERARLVELGDEGRAVRQQVYGA